MMSKEDRIKYVIKMYKRGVLWDYEAIAEITKILED